MNPKSCQPDSTAQHTDPWKHFQTLLHNGFRPPTGAGRCQDCGYHTKTQGHRGGCPKTRKRGGATAPKVPTVWRGPEVREHLPGH